MKLNEILDELNKLTAQVKEMQCFENEDDGSGEYILDSDDDSYVLKASHGYDKKVDDLCELTDTGNGYIAYFRSYSSTRQDNYICIDYAEADYLRKLLSYIHRKNK